MDVGCRTSCYVRCCLFVLSGLVGMMALVVELEPTSLFSGSACWFDVTCLCYLVYLVS